MTTTQQFSGFIVRRYSDYTNMGGYAVIETDILESVEETLDEIVEYLKNQMEEANDEPLTEKEWASVRAQMLAEKRSDQWQFDPNDFEEFMDTCVPVSIKINEVKLSDRLIRRIQGGAKTTKTSQQ